jgi:hypothetical protein
MTTSDWWQAECARLRVELEATERARREAEEERDAVLELVAPDAVEAARLRDDRDAALATLRVALADADLILEERERQLTAALADGYAESDRCAAVCREVAARRRHGACGCAECGARECAEAIERGEAGQCSPHSSRGNT